MRRPAVGKYGEARVYQPHIISRNGSMVNWGMYLVTNSRSLRQLSYSQLGGQSLVFNCRIRVCTNADNVKPYLVRKKTMREKSIQFKILLVELQTL